jgi:oxaloacetate decarboxylase gamma subunit
MNANALIAEGFNLMLIGMGFVFVFLTVLVMVTALMSRVITFYEKRVGILPAEGIPQPTAVVGVSTEPSSPPKDANLISVLSGAIHRYRAKHK